MPIVGIRDEEAEVLSRPEKGAEWHVRWIPSSVTIETIRLDCEAGARCREPEGVLTEGRLMVSTAMTIQPTKSEVVPMRAAAFHGPGDIRVENVPRPTPGPGEAVIRVTLTTICGTDVHILKGEYPVREGLIVGHEPVGVIEALGPGVTGYAVGDRVIAGAITPCGQCRACLSGDMSQCGHGGDGYEAIGGWRFGNTINGCQAEYVLVPNAQANLAKIPDGLRDEEVVLCTDIMSTGLS